MIRNPLLQLVMLCLAALLMQAQIAQETIDSRLIGADPQAANADFELYAQFALANSLPGGAPLLAPMTLAQPGEDVTFVEDRYPGISTGEYAYKIGDPVSLTMVDRAYSERRIAAALEEQTQTLQGIQALLAEIAQKPAGSVQIDAQALREAIAQALDQAAQQLRSIE